MYGIAQNKQPPNYHQSF